MQAGQVDVTGKQSGDIWWADDERQAKGNGAGGNKALGK